MTAPLFEIRGLTVMRGRRPALEVPECAIRDGAVTAIIGPNGAGKSTLLLALMRLNAPAHGEITFRGSPVPLRRNLHRYRRRLALVPQEPVMLYGTARDNVAAGLTVRGVSRADAVRETDRTMRLLGITHLADRRAVSLSGGEARRVAIARALACRPEAALMDEPFSGLDAPTRAALMDDLERIVHSEGLTVVYATHDREEAFRLSDDIIVMKQGRILQQGTPEDILSRPADEFVAAFMGADTILRGTVTACAGGTVTVSVNNIDVEAAGEAFPGQTAILCVHPDSVVLSRAPSVTSARNTFPGRIIRILPLGLYRKVYVDCGFTIIASVTNRSCDDLGLVEGAQVIASFKATGVHIISPSQERRHSL